MTILSDIVTGWGVGQALTVLYQLLSRYFDRRVLQRRKWKNSWDISDSVADFWVPLENKRILPGDLVQVHRTALCEIVPLTYWGETRNRYLVNLMEENKARGVDFAHPDRDAFSGRMYNMTLLTLYAGVRLLPRNGIRLIAACYEEGFGDQDGYLFTTANAIPLILPESVYNSILSKRLRAQGSAVCELRANRRPARRASGWGTKSTSKGDMASYPKASLERFGRITNRIGRLQYYNRFMALDISRSYSKSPVSLPVCGCVSNASSLVADRQSGRRAEEKL